MNRKQLAYQIGRVCYNNYDVISLTLATKFGYDCIDNFLNSQGFSNPEAIAIGTLNGLMALYGGFSALKSGAARVLLYSESRKIFENRKTCPLEHSEKMIIDDAVGLNFLLEKTRNDESKEWGTLLKAQDDMGRAVIYDILGIMSAKEKGLIGEETRRSIRIECKKAIGEGYKGYHHYHPSEGPKWLGAMNFSVSLIDRYKPEGWINLLTFNLPEGPEIVGFNRQHIYIPKDKTKRELIIATPVQIMEYLRK